MPAQTVGARQRGAGLLGSPLVAVSIVPATLIVDRNVLRAREHRRICRARDWVQMPERKTFAMAWLQVTKFRHTSAI